MGTSDPVISQSSYGIVLFDGVCNLCNGAVQFIIRHDKKARFKFASLQSPFGQQQQLKFGLNPSDLHSILLVQGDYVYDRSDAALEISRHLDGIWSIFYGFKIIPTFLRNAVYNFVARNRYRIFGKKDECMLPTPELRYRFIE